MALSLSAEQKELSKIFHIEEQYIVPSYQRPYSWEYDQCFQLYNDLISAFNSQQDYFIGNIIIAKADNNRGHLEVVDGQQRLITHLLIFKVLYLLQPEMKKLKYLLEQENWEGNIVSRVRSDVFEAKDEESLSEVLNYDINRISERLEEVLDKKNDRIIEKKCLSRFESNILFFYHWFRFFSENQGNLKDFTVFILSQVYLLPIELSGPTQDEANEKALVIFETINNRGMNLEDADIFKAKLYNKAKKVKEERLFISQWTDFKGSCETLGINIDDVFRYYSHIIRGKEGITTGEKNLREFFINERFSPLELNKYQEVLNDLFQIIAVLELFNQESIKETEAAKWLQIINAYTNQYPKYAIVNYLFVNNMRIDERFIEFIKSLIRYVYYQGSTSTVKFEIYTIIKQVSSNFVINSYKLNDVSSTDFDYLGRLKKGFALLAYYLNSSKALPSYTVDRIINSSDRKFLPDWDETQFFYSLDDLGNFVVLDIPKRNIALNRKKEYFETSKLDDVKNLLADGVITYSAFAAREEELKNRLVKFFSL